MRVRIWKKKEEVEGKAVEELKQEEDKNKNDQRNR
jgi:hypothetical protein